MIKFQLRRFCIKLAEKDLYKILGVARNADKNDIKTEFHKKAKLYHPDMNKTGKMLSLQRGE